MNFTTRLPATALYCEQPQPWLGYLYDVRHVHCKNTRGDEFVTPYLEQYGDSVEGAENRMARAIYCDGPRGVGHVTPYISGAVLPNGDLAFVETSPRGRVGVLSQDGTVTTIVGYRLRSDVVPYNPNDLTISDAIVAEQYQHIGDADARLALPTDIAIDPSDPGLWYIADSDNHRIALCNRRTRQVRTYAGVPGTEGYRDGLFTQALFHYPTSITVLPDRTMCVADSENHCIRKITPQGMVSTEIGANPLPGGVARPPQSKFNSYTKVQQRAWRVNGYANQATLLYPLCVRANSRGDILILEPWFSSIRRYVPSTGYIETLRDLPGSREWNWIDVDVKGEAGPKDDIFLAHMLSNIWRVYGDGSGYQELMPGSQYFPCVASQSSAPHYPWMCATGGGAVWTSGFGNIGITRIRKLLPTDYVDTPADIARYKRGQALWLRGSVAAPAGISDMPGMNLRFGRFGVGGLEHISTPLLESKIGFAAWLSTEYPDEEFTDAEIEDIRYYLNRHRGVRI